MSSSVVPAVASTALRPLLDGPEQPARVLGVTRAAAYVGLAAEPAIVALVHPAAVRLPNAVVVDPKVLAALAGGAAASLGGGRVTVGSVRVVPRRWWDPRPRLGRVGLGPLADRLAAFEAALPTWHAGAAPFAAPLRRSTQALAEALAAGDASGAAAAAAGLVGLGPGLTPAGDDVLAGALAALRLLGEAAGVRAAGAEAALTAVTRAAGGRTTELSASLLRHASRGEVAVPAAAALRALAGRGGVEDAVRGLLVVGHTSGHDLARGIHAGAGAVAARAPEGAVAR